MMVAQRSSNLRPPDIHTAVLPRRRMAVWVLCLMIGSFAITGCGSLEPIAEQEVSDLQLTVDTLRTSLRDAQRSIAELRTELEARRQELADSQIARAQMDGKIREAERRLVEARHVIDLQREELTASRAERQRVAHASAALQSQLKQLQKQLSKLGKQADSGNEAGAAPAALSSVKKRQPVVRPVTMGQDERTPDRELAVQDTGIGQASEEVSTSGPTPLSNGRIRVAVKSGDTLWSIAQRHHVSVHELRALNQMGDDRILVGQALWLPQQAVPGASPLPQPE